MSQTWGFFLIRNSDTRERSLFYYFYVIFILKKLFPYTTHVSIKPKPRMKCEEEHNEEFVERVMMRGVEIGRGGEGGGEEGR